MDSDASNGSAYWVNGLPGIVILVMDFPAPDDWTAGVVIPVMTPIPWLDGLPGIVILVDSDILGERVAGCRSFVMGGLPDGRVAGYRNLVDFDALDVRVDGYRPS